jgi:hypothetical protein
MEADSPEGRQPGLSRDAKFCVSTEPHSKRQEGGLRTMSEQPDPKRHALIIQISDPPAYAFGQVLDFRIKRNFTQYFLLFPVTIILLFIWILLDATKLKFVHL